MLRKIFAVLVTIITIFAIIKSIGILTSTEKEVVSQRPILIVIAISIVLPLMLLSLWLWKPKAKNID